MAQVFEFEVPIKPRPKGNRDQIRKSRRPDPRTGRRRQWVSPPDDIQRLEREVARIAHFYAPAEPIEGPVRLDVSFVFAPSKSWKESRKADALEGLEAPISSRWGDRGNLLKLLEDALEKAGFFRDDAQIVEGDVRKVFGQQSCYRIRVQGLEKERVR